MAEDGKVVKMLCAAPRFDIHLLDRIFNETQTVPSMGFNGIPTDKSEEYAYYLFQNKMEAAEFADKIGKLEGVLGVEVVDISDMCNY